MKNYTGDGGNLLATFETSLFDTSGVKRKTLVLLKFLVAIHWKKVNTRKDCYHLFLSRNIGCKTR
jgi:hypothetical protein